MDREMNRPKNLLDPKEIAHSLLAQAEGFEKVFGTSPLRTIEAHSIMNALESITSASFAPPAPLGPSTPIAQAQPSVAAPAPVAPAATAVAKPQAAAPATSRPSAPSPRFETKNQQYQPALKDRSLIEALLNYHQSARAAGKAPSTPAPAQQAQAQAAGFQAAQVPQVAAEPKTNAIQPGAGRVRAPILRPNLP